REPCERRLHVVRLSEPVQSIRLCMSEDQERPELHGIRHGGAIGGWVQRLFFSNRRLAQHPLSSREGALTERSAITHSAIHRWPHALQRAQSKKRARREGCSEWSS